MIDMENVISTLEEIKTQTAEIGLDSAVIAHEFIDKIIALLKEQEAVEPIYIENPYTHLPVSYCPKCREPINQYITGNPYKETKYCHYCGQAVKWE